MESFLALTMSFLINGAVVAVFAAGFFGSASAAQVGLLSPRKAAKKHFSLRKKRKKRRTWLAIRTSRKKHVLDIIYYCIILHLTAMLQPRQGGGRSAAKELSDLAGSEKMGVLWALGLFATGQSPRSPAARR